MEIRENNTGILLLLWFHMKRATELTKMRNGRAESATLQCENSAEGGATLLKVRTYRTEYTNPQPDMRYEVFGPKSPYITSSLTSIITRGLSSYYLLFSRLRSIMVVSMGKKWLPSLLETIATQVEPFMITWAILGFLATGMGWFDVPLAVHERGERLNSVDTLIITEYGV